MDEFADEEDERVWEIPRRWEITRVYYDGGAAATGTSKRTVFTTPSR